MLKRLMLVASLGLACCAPPASAQRAAITQQGFGPDGLPRLVANPIPDGGQGHVVAWRACAPSAPCGPVGSGAADERALATGDVPAGTVFEADVADASGQITTARSTPWLGRVTAIKPPWATGALKVGQQVTPVPATWSGGWTGDGDLLGLEACRDRAGTRCETLSAERAGLPTCPGAGAVIAPRYAGWWIRAVDARVSYPLGFAGVGYPTLRAIPAPAPTRTLVVSRPLGPVKESNGAFHECATPAIGLKSRIRRNAGSRPLILAHVYCVTGCAVRIVVRDGARTYRMTTDPDAGGYVALPEHTRLSGPTAA